ncbi:hypothetical protein BU045_05690 [Staphylococcus simulans]|uniref:phage tail protein n=1 Tax=Staphylococcus simulans TaxID=1286 RepID=UPI000D1F27A3|nr:phage tail protein [Staphylococcus simulans]PTI93395.1 hypothetical protein BU045_05690 [Staphylococcus simulans]PTJ95390.1 hypothetical protein BU013_11645 [Staphylococcus simulans]
MINTYIRSNYENIYVDGESVGDGWYPDGAAGTWIANDKVYTTKPKRTDYLVGGFLTIRNYTTNSFYMTFWDVNGNFISTRTAYVTNGLYYFDSIPTNANDVSFTFWKDTSGIEINKIGKSYVLDAALKHEQELNGDERIDLEIEYTENNAEFLSQNIDLNMWIIEYDNKEYVIINEERQGYGQHQKASCTAILYQLFRLNTDRVYQRYDESLTTTEAYNIVFSATPFTYVVVDAAPSSRFEGLGDGDSKLEIFKKLLDRYGHEFKIVGNVFYLYSKIGNDTNFEFRYKINATNIKKSVNAENMYTYIRGYADFSDDNEGEGSTPISEKAKIKREYTSPLAKFLGKLHAPMWHDGRVKYASVVDKTIKKIVDDSLEISFTADIVDMSEQGYDYQNAQVGDRVFLVDERIGLDREIRVVKIVKEVDANGKLLKFDITFGTGDVTDKYESKLSTAVKDINDIMEGNKAIPFFALGDIARSMVTKISNTSSELVFDTNGIHAIDKTNPNNIVTMNSSGWYLSTDGGRTGKTAMTAEGIVADSITTGNLLTSMVNIVGRNALMYMDGDQFVAKSNVDKRKTVISPSGITITRPDGAAWVENGMFKSAMDIQMAMPQPISAGVEIKGSYYVTANTEKSYVEEYFFQHKARYLHILGRAKMKHSTSSKYNGQVFVENPSDGGVGIVGTQVVPGTDVVSDSGNEAGTLIDITIDLGVPTYGYKHFYILIKSASGNSEIFFRRSLVELKD